MKKTLLMIALFAAGLAVGVWWAKPVAEGGESPNAEDSAEIQSRADEDESSSGEEGEDCQSEVRPQEGEKPLAKVTAKVGKLKHVDGCSVRAALVYDGELAETVPADGYFDAIVSFRRLIGM